MADLEALLAAQSIPSARLAVLELKKPRLDLLLVRTGKHLPREPRPATPGSHKARGRQARVITRQSNGPSRPPRYHENFSLHPRLQHGRHQEHIWPLVSLTNSSPEQVSDIYTWGDG